MINVYQPKYLYLVEWIGRVCFILFCSINILWLYYLVASRFEIVKNHDWVVFQDTARLLLSHRTHEIYPGITRNLPFFYPPYFIPLIAPLGLLSRLGGYVAVVLSMVAATAAALCVLRRVLPSNGPSYATGVMAVLSSAGWTQLTIWGHFSALYLLIVVSGLLLWSREQRLLAGAVLSLMMLKPNFGLMFPLIFLVRRQWPLLLGWLGGFALLLSCTIPLGWTIWVDYVGNSRTLAAVLGGQIAMWRQQTIYAFWRSALELPQSPQVTALWLTSTIPLLVLTMAAWLRIKLDAQHLPRLFGITILSILCCNLYLFAYDTILLALPGMVWYMHRASYRSTACHRTIGIALLVIYLWQYFSLWIIHGGWAIVGPAMAVWLIADAWDLLGTFSTSLRGCLWLNRF